MEFSEEETRQMLSVLKLYRSWMFHSVKEHNSSLDASSKNHFVASLGVTTTILKKLEASLGETSSLDDSDGKAVTLKSAAEANVLVTDDDEITVEIISTCLEDFGFKTIDTASDGQAALDKLESDQKYDLVVCDWRMPNLNGLEVHSRAKELGKLDDSVFVLLTAIDDEVLASRAEKQGVSFYLTKPFETEEFEAILKTLFSF